jgi:hypothetical protein
VKAVKEWCWDITKALIITTIIWWLINKIGFWQLLYLILKAIADNNN